jgi:hypothetical protein
MYSLYRHQKISIGKEKQQGINTRLGAYVP